MAKQTNNKPVQTFKAWPLSAAIWQQEHDGRKFYNATLERTYKEENAYKSSSSLGKDDLLAASALLKSAWWWIIRQEQKDMEEKGD